MSRIKICGITKLEDALLAESLGADFIGLIFTRHSQRRIGLEQAKIITRHLTRAKPIGVFVEQSLDETLAIASAAGLYGIQHTQMFTQKVDNFLYIYAQNIANTYNETSMAAITPDLFLFDTKKQGLHGGTGEVFNWSLLPPAQMSRIIIAGGIGVDNVGEVLRHRPYAIDLSSRVEKEPGIKDHAKLEQLFKEIAYARNI